MGTRFNHLFSLLPLLPYFKAYLSFQTHLSLMILFPITKIIIFMLIPLVELLAL